MKMYRVKLGYMSSITPIEVEKNTDKSVWYKDSRGTLQQERTKTEWQHYYHSLDEAKHALVSIGQIKVDKAQSALDYANAEQNKIIDYVTNYKEPITNEQ